MIEASNILSQPDIRHGFFTRLGGYSKGIYESLNCGQGSDDKPQNVLLNRTHVATSLGINPPQLISLHQIHSSDVVVVDKIWPDNKKPKADGFVTTKPGIGLGILTADCTPVLFADRVNPIIGAAHAGWRGALAGVTTSVIEAMIALGSKRENIMAAIGPTISQSNYEVGPELLQTFTDLSEENTRFFVSSVRENHYMFDLPAYVEHLLHKDGLHLVENSHLCTYGDEARFFSYRRGTHRNEPDYGRQISAITLGPDAFLRDA